jgi:N-acetylglucosamine kinase-like BadF-type ATPase
MFGDEGSGAHLGKTYIRQHLKNQVPAEIYVDFESEFSFTPEEILTHVYKKPNPNRFLASFSVFLKKHEEHPFISKLVETCFYEFFSEQVTKYTNYREVPFSFIGSVGYNFRDQLSAAAQKHGITIGRYMVSPMEGLKEFHNS